MSELLSWITSIGPSILFTAAGASWALVTFRRNSRIKAAEILISLEARYGTHIPTLLEIEEIAKYNGVYRAAINKSLSNSGEPFTQEESDAINCLEAALRHFHLCAAVRQLSVDVGSIDQLCSWYLRIFVPKNGDRGNTDRPELQTYVRTFWPSLYFWAQLSGQPWPKRLLFFDLQIRDRLISWWNPARGVPRLVDSGRELSPADGAIRDSY